METTKVFYWGYIGIMEKKMETTVVCWGYVRVIVAYDTCKGRCCISASEQLPGLVSRPAHRAMAPHHTPWCRKETPGQRAQGIFPLK